jgi:ribosomal protein S18 acetylase RimI-like enzyme
MTSLVQACAALTESLIDDPFYCSITEGFGGDLVARKRALSRYFHYALEEAERTGRCVMAEDPRLGAAAWLLPRPGDVEVAESRSKFEFLGSALGSGGKENYYRIVRYMAPLAARVIPPSAWYLSIIGIVPWAQGRGLGATLLASTLSEAERANVACYLETFTPRTLKFYQPLGFRTVANHIEPTTHKELCNHAERYLAKLSTETTVFSAEGLEDSAARLRRSNDLDKRKTLPSSWARLAASVD